MTARTLVPMLILAACAIDPREVAPSSAEVAPASAADAAESEEGAAVLDFHDDQVRTFLLDALAGRLPADATITYEVLVQGPDGLPMGVDVTMGVGVDEGEATYDIALMSEYTLNWCEEVGPSVTRTIWATSCSKSTAKSTAQSWAVSLADDDCEATLDLSDGDAACAPDNFDDNVCVSGSGTWTSVCQHGSDTACGVWPVRHAQWKATYRFTGDCGFNCSTDPF